MRLLKNFLLERTLKSGNHDKILQALASLTQGMTEKQELLLLDNGNAEELCAYFKRHYFGKTAEHRFFCTAPDELQLQYLQKCNRENVPLQNRNTAGPIISNVNRSLCDGANHELIMQLLYLMKATSYRPDADSEYNLVCRGNEQELLLFISQLPFMEAETENLFLRTAASQLTDLYSELYNWHTGNVVNAIKDNWNEFARYYAKKDLSGKGKLSPDEEKALLIYGNTDFVSYYLSDNRLSEEATDFLVKEGNDERYALWLNSNGKISADTFGWLLSNNEERALSFLSQEKQQLTEKAENILLTSGTTKEVLAYIEKHALWSNSFKKLLDRNVREEILSYLPKYTLLSEQFRLLLSRGITEEITAYVSACRNLKPDDQLFLIGRGNTDEITAYLKNRNCELAPTALTALQMRSILSELELLTKNDA